MKSEIGETLKIDHTAKKYNMTSLNSHKKIKELIKRQGPRYDILA